MLPRKLFKRITFGFFVILCIKNLTVTATVNHSCYRCERKECEEPVIFECKKAKNNDKCFIQFDPSNYDVVAMGCLVDFSEPKKIEEHIKNKTLLLCDGVNCNDFAILSNTNQCTECTSLSEEACATKPETIIKKKTCNNIAYPQCYERVNGSVTHRGCVHDLVGDEFYKCLTGDDKNCKICVGKNCNENIIPSNRKKCLHCNSQNDFTCEHSPSVLSVCPSYNKTDSCAAIFENGITKRGCQTEFTCDYRSKNCHLCEKDGCNSYNIKRRFDDLYGIFQDLPLNCYTCLEDDCKFGKPLNPNKCESDAYQDCMTIFDTKGNVIQRGCELNVLRNQHSHCTLNPDLCFKCKSNGCNDMTNASIHQECYYCDAATNPNCLLKPNVITTTRNCTLGCVSSLYLRKTSKTVQDFVRTCFEDIEKDNRDSCTTENSCVKCFDKKCNTAILPDTERLSCLYCNGSDCDMPLSKQCVGYNANDMCYIYFDNNTLSAVRMGCRSDVSDDQMRQEIKQYFVCDGDNCNDYNNLPAPLTCTVCDSEDDVNCAVNITKIKIQKYCRNLPYTQCYTRIRNKIHTSRGCLSELSTDDFISCHDGHPNSKCRVCTADNCNRNMFPGSRQKCFRCSSITDPNCEGAAVFTQPCPHYKEVDGCVTQYVNGTTTRACASEITCEGLSRKNCRKCSDNNCNNINLANEDIGELGLFTSLPLRCHQCNGTLECSNHTTSLETCGNNVYQSCTTIFNKTGAVIARGCSGSLEHTCSYEGNICFECKSNSCNVATTKRDYIDCLHCDAKDNEKCVFNANAITRTRKCFKSCMTALYPRTSEINPVYELVRTCLDDKNLNDRINCEASKDSKCISCTDKNCNVDVLGKRKSCYQCKGVECKSPKAQTCRAVTDNDQCFVRYDERGLVDEFGCRSKYNSSEVDILVEQKRLWLCDADNCNSNDNVPKLQSCMICSSRTDENCSINPKNVSATTTCNSTPYKQCYSRVLDNGHTDRGCLSNLEGDEFLDCLNNKNNTKCLACVGQNCNQEIYPAGRRSCFRCNSKDNPQCEKLPTYASICPIFLENQYCTAKLVNGYTYRGCSSEFKCDDDKQHCRSCQNEDNCNAVSLVDSFVGNPGKWQKLPLSCHHCEDTECNNGNKTLQKCEGHIQQTCMTVFNAEGFVVKRGCSDSLNPSLSNYCDENTDKCLACKSNSCNNADSLDNYINCYFCDSSESSSCAVEFDARKSMIRKCHKSCMVALYPRTSRNDTSYALTRTCLDDLDLSDRNNCTEGNKELCKVCDSPLCNTMSIPDDHFECYKCIDDDCEDMVSKQCNFYHPNEQCFVMYNNVSSIVSMGCLSDLKPNVLNKPDMKKQLLLCKEKNCNAPENLPTAQLCSVCNSAENPLCATNPNLVNNITRCATLPFTQCVTRVKSNGHTYRGCVANLETEEFYDCIIGADNLCETCAGDKCNNINVYPENRRTCQQCNSVTYPNCGSLPSNNKVCELYSKDDYCMTNYHRGITTRGCKSSMECDDENDPLSCRTCQDNNCNTINMKIVLENGYPGRWQDTPLSCYTCKGEENCSSNADFLPCLKDPLQHCMTVFNEKTGKVFQRGCSNLVEQENQSYCDRNPDKCLRCNSNGCNIATSLDQYVECSYCDTEANGSCVSNPAGNVDTRQCYKYCMTALYPRFKEENPSYGLSRSCYDDMDYADRLLCLAGNKEHCKICNTPKCNLMSMPEKRFSCYVCEGDGCSNPKQQACSSYRSSDKCYMLFDERKEIVALGCRSQFSNEEAKYLVKNKRLFECNDENCNNINTIPKAQTCTLCNSRTNKNCAVNATAVRSETECIALPYTHCYLRVLPDGTTERGCLSNLYDDEFLGCLNGTSATCKSCQGNHCNNKDFPDTRLMCYICDSSTDPDCEATPNRLSFCSKYDSADTCVTAFRNNVTKRDCSSNLNCDATNSLACSKCVGKGCNTVNLATKQDINFGLWQDLPLTCLSCYGNDCDSNTTTKPLVCQMNNKQDCITVFNDKEKVIARGCSDSFESAFCTKDESNCYRCKSNKCNTATSKSVFKECVYCNSYNSQDCVWNPSSAAFKTRKCDGGCMTAIYPSYGTNSSTFDLIRTCLNDKESYAQKTCARGKDKKCSVCSGEKCNTVNIPENRLSCLICKGQSCEKPEPKLCPLHRENDQCFIRFDDENSIVDMGCISSFKDHDLESIIKTKRVQVCSGKNCNGQIEQPGPQICAVCDSKSNTSCAVEPTAISTFSTCSMLPYTSCYTKLHTKGATERGCAADLPADEFVACIFGKDENCSVCNGNGCNREIFPWDRQQCFTCETLKQDKSCESFPTTKKACPIVSDIESCVTALSGNITIRGCKSLVHCDENDRSTCRSCYGSECNSIDLLNKEDDGYHGVWQELPLKCYTCKDDHCLHSLGPSNTCSSQNIKQDCMTVFDEQGNVERRGCSDDVEDYRDLYCRIHPERCFKCKSNECNFAWSMEEYVNCLFCDSTNEPSCVLNPSYSGFKTRKCYKNCMVAMTSEKLMRSCLDDKEILMQNQCKLNNTNECLACSGNSCNTFVFPTDRLQCHVCTGSSCSNSVSQPCEKYDSSDYCFAKYENGVVNLMGCASSQKPNNLAEWTTQKKIYKCDNNDCNAPSNLPKTVCLSCDSSKNHFCAQNPSEVSTTVTCPIPTDKCLSRIDNEGHTIRECLSRTNVTEQSCASSDACAICEGEKCNNLIIPASRLTCHICNSTADSNCKQNPSYLKVCPIYDLNEKCVSALDSHGSFLRGCSSQVQCSISNDDYCNICNGHGCNNVDLKGSANLVSNSIFLILFPVLTLLFMLKY